MNILVVGAGISGCKAARLLADQGHAVEVLDSRPHSGGNCHDERQGEVTVHCHGPHLFHHAWFNRESPAETLITREYPEAHDGSNEPYYPMPFGEGRELYRKYRDLAAGEPDTMFLGRLATYSYLDMWMAVAQAMVRVRRLGKSEDPTDSTPTVAETITSP